MKKVFIWISVGIGVFVVLIVIIFAVLSYLNPVDEIVQTEMSVNNISTTNNLIEKKEIEIDSLKEEVNNIKSELFFY